MPASQAAWIVSCIEPAEVAPGVALNNTLGVNPDLARVLVTCPAQSASRDLWEGDVTAAGRGASESGPPREVNVGACPATRRNQLETKNATVMVAGPAGAVSDEDFGISAADRLESCGAAGRGANGK